MKFLVLSNLQDILYEELESCLINNKYTDIILLGNVDLYILNNLNTILKNNSICKHVFTIENLKNNLFNIESININLKTLYTKNITINGVNSYSKSSFDYSKFADYETKNIIFSDFNPEYDKEIFFNEVNKHNNLENINKDYDLWIYSENNFNTINIINNTYILGICGISILDTKDYSLLKLY